MTTAAAEIAAIATDGHNSGTGLEMPHRFIFDPTHVYGGENPIGKIVERTMTVYVRLTKTTLSMTNFTMPQTEIAARGLLVQLFLQSSLDQLIVLRRCRCHCGS
jgi:hypothetical protein